MAYAVPNGNVRPDSKFKKMLVAESTSILYSIFQGCQIAKPSQSELTAALDLWMLKELWTLKKTTD